MTSSRQRHIGRSPATRSLVIQPLPGIGDMIWHLPHIKAIARASPEGRVAVLTKRRSLAASLLKAEPAVVETLWVDRNPGRHDGPLGFLRLVMALRRQGFDRAWVLHQSPYYARLAWAAGIGERHGYGVGQQKTFLNASPFLPKDFKVAHPIDRADALLAAAGLEIRPEDRQLQVCARARAAVEERYHHLPRPWSALALGSSAAFKQWGVANFQALARRLAEETEGSLFLLGGRQEASMAEQISQAVQSVNNAVALPIEETSALISDCRYLVGNDTGVLNISAAVGTDVLGLFGSTPPLTYSPYIHRITPKNLTQGMAGITVDQVIDEIFALKLAQAAA